MILAGPRQRARARRAPAGDALCPRRVGAADDRARIPAESRPRRPRHAGRLRAGAPAAQGAARHRAGDRRRVRHARGRSRGVRGAQRLPELLSRAAGVPPRAPPEHRRRPARRAPARPSSSTRRSIRTRRRTSATCATPRSATRWCGCCASAAFRSRCRTTSTTPASRWPTSSSASACIEGKTLDEIRAIADSTRFDYYCWDLYARVTDWYGDDKERLAVRAETLHDIEHGGNDNAGSRRLHRRPHRPLPPEDDGADERRLRPADVGGRHPAPEVLGAGVRRAEGQGAPSTCGPRDGSPAAG